MKTIFLIIAIFTSHALISQNCYQNVNPKDYPKDFSQLWLEKTFQGTIGDQNQRIELRFTSVTQSNSEKQLFIVIGKSKVKDNICDFKGEFKILSLEILDLENSECESPDYPFGSISGEYRLFEDSSQNHVGEFKGTFNTMFAEKANQPVYHPGWFSDEGVNEFIGTWQGYDKAYGKYCSWGLQIPPSKKGDLFKHYESEFYLFNPKYLDKGWKTYVISNLKVFILLPVDFERQEARFKKDFITAFGKEEIEMSQNAEKIEWWK